MTARLVVYGCPGREAMTAQTVGALHADGGADFSPCLSWAGPNPPSVPKGWTVARDYGGPRGGRQDFWRVLNQHSMLWPGRPLLVCEDDIVPAVGAIRYMANWAHDTFTTFYNHRGYTEGPRQLDASGFWGTQAVFIPARLVGRFADENPERWFGKGGHKNKHEQDLVLGRILRAWKEPVFYHRSLVQHIGEVSICSPGAKLTGIRITKDFTGKV